MANRNKGYRNKVIDTGITFRDFVNIQKIEPLLHVPNAGSMLGATTL